ncbi:MAG: peptidoglycan-binding domain-containing protein, partial [Candidatus Udaeobacter sp.]
MRIFVITICSLALATGAYSAEPEQNQQQKKKQPQTVHHAPAATTAHPTGHPSGAGANPKRTSMEAYHGQQGAYHGQKVNQGHPPTEAYHGQQGTYHGQKVNQGHPPTEAYHGQQGTYYGQKGKKGQTPVEAYHGQKGKNGQTSTAAYQGQPGKGGKVTGATVATGKSFKAQHFNVAKQFNTAKAPPVKFQQGRHIEGSQNWQGAKYAVFRNYHSEWHDQGWWHSHYGNNIVWTFGAPYYFSSGYWFPAWGYAPNASYAWDGPIYAYNRLPPDQVIANVQSALQQQGYYNGEVDGLIGPITRGAIADYQRDHGLYTTSTIDEPTL